MKKIILSIILAVATLTVTAQIKVEVSEIAFNVGYHLKCLILIRITHSISIFYHCCPLKIAKRSLK